MGAQILVHLGPVGLAWVGDGLEAVAVEARLELWVGHTLGQRPGKARDLEALRHIPDGRVRDAHGAGDSALTELRLELEPQDLSGLAHGHSPVGHRPPPSSCLSKESLAVSSMRRFF
jgi:hypothetical protein